jgi:serine/threonine protein phosphatase 1
MPSTLYAVGDVHGCLQLLVKMEAEIAADKIGDGDKLVVMLGDYVDRGPHSAQVLDRLLASPPSGVKRICLAGNHEAAMLSFIEKPSSDAAWLRFGGLSTLSSYGIDRAVMRFAQLSTLKFKQVLDSHIPTDHIDFLREMPVLVSLPEITMVHAGLREGVLLDDQEDRDLLWTRLSVPDSEAFWVGLLIHGHTPQSQPLLGARRICVDTESYRSGRLSAVRVKADHTVSAMTCTL